MPDVGVLILGTIHQCEADKQRGGTNCAHENDGVEQAIVSKVHEEQDHEGCFRHRDDHGDRQVDVGAEVDPRRQHGDERQDQQGAARG